jgi:hypothetical protein
MCSFSVLRAQTAENVSRHRSSVIQYFGLGQSSVRIEVRFLILAKEIKILQLVLRKMKTNFSVLVSVM